MPDIPEGTSGDWKIERFTVTKEDADRTKNYAAMHMGHGYVPPGTYTKLTRNGGIIMSDTPDEIEDHRSPMFQAGSLAGHVLIAGLGLGLVTRGILLHANVLRVTVVEISADVIKLVGPHIQDDRLEIVEADIHKWRAPKGVRYTVAWFDIWGDLTSDDLAEMIRLKRRFAKRSVYKGCWREWACRRMKRHGY
jgi:hypothetical protein